MIDPGYCRLMAEYNRWMNEKVYAACAELPDAERRRDHGAAFGSISGTLNHLLWGDRAWMARFTGRSVSLPALGEELYDTFEELRTAREEMDREILAWAEELTPGWLGAPFEFHSRVYDRRWVLPAWTLVVHMFNHQTHHRGQLTTLLHQLGLDPGVTDIPWLPSLTGERVEPGNERTRAG
jgi:uncharacterized damage-inducible protein DinB